MSSRPLPSPLRVIVGPTGAGKSAIAMSLAETLGRAPSATRVVLVSADSRQVYTGFDIGTAKPTPAERARVPHACLDTTAPTARCSAHAWAACAREAIAEAQATGAVPVVVGGTGFYVQALVQPLAEVPPLDAARRAALSRRLDALPTEELHRWCAALDPARSALGPAQWRRAVEVALLTGRPLSAWHADAPPAPPLPARYLLVDPGAVLAERIATRLDAMCAAGWLDEVRRLMDTVPDDAPAWQSTGYAAWRDALRGDITMGEARTRVVHATRQYAKRQRTWFRHQLPADAVTRLDPTAPDALDRARAWWDAA